MKKLKNGMLVLMSLLLFACCSNDDDTTTEGTLRVVFNNPPSTAQEQLTVYVFSLYDKSYPIIEKDVPENKQVDIDLNIGNYMVKASSDRSSDFYEEQYCQVQQGKVCTVSYRRGN